MDIRKIRKLIELLDETGMAEIEVTTGDDMVRIKRYPDNSNPAPTVQTISHAPAPVAALAAAPAAAPEPAAPAHSGHEVNSPMVGTAYFSATPGDPPFVAIGQRVNVGDTLCLIEAMKMFNKIEADKAGVVSARLFENEQPVEFGQALFIIDTEE